MKYSPINIIFLLPLFILFSCGSAPKSTKSSSDALITGSEIYADATFSAIQNNTARLRAMLCGKYVHYSPNEEGVYEAWKVNNGADSIVMYSVPIGEPNKVGYWVFHYQMMTSLPDEPIYQVFENLTEIDRDSIKGIYYEVPEDFVITHHELLQKQTKAFNEITLDKSKLNPDGDEVLYVRQSPLLFNGKTAMLPAMAKEDQGMFEAVVYKISPTGILYQINVYKKETDEEPVGQKLDKFIKLGMFR